MYSDWIRLDVLIFEMDMPGENNTGKALRNILAAAVNNLPGLMHVTGRWWKQLALQERRRKRWRR
jgi:hypothetical protein